MFDGDWCQVPLPAPLQAVGDINSEYARLGTVLFVDGDHDGGTPRLLLVSGGRVGPGDSVYETPPTGPFRRVMYNGEGLVVADSADPPVLWHGWPAIPRFEPLVLVHPPEFEARTPVDERGHRPVDVWTVCDDDIGSPVFGTVPDEGGVLQVRPGSRTGTATTTCRPTCRISCTYAPADRCSAPSPRGC